MNDRAWRIVEGDGPVVATAIHSGHDLRPEIAELTALSSDERLREEDPFTDVWTLIAPTRVTGNRSRFEFDLNRPREKAIYQTPDDAWGLNLWREPLAEPLVDESLAMYDAFYSEVESLLARLVEKHGQVLVYDLHAYNHRRGGPTGEPADMEGNPEINLGTGTMDRPRWAGAVDRFLTEIRQFDFGGRLLDVRENVKFRGGNFPRWIHERFPKSVCVLSVEMKKTFMDEWTGQGAEQAIEQIGRALAATVEPVVRELKTS